MTIKELIAQAEQNCLNERHLTQAEIMYWYDQWKILALAFATEIQAEWSRAGRTKSKTKSKAARENGKLGGRPRKVK